MGDVDSQGEDFVYKIENKQFQMMMPKKKTQFLVSKAKILNLCFAHSKWQALQFHFLISFLNLFIVVNILNLPGITFHIRSPLSEVISAPNVIVRLCHCVKSVQIRSYIWSEYRKTRTTRNNSVFGHFSRSMKILVLGNF